MKHSLTTWITVFLLLSCGAHTSAARAEAQAPYSVEGLRAILDEETRATVLTGKVVTRKQVSGKEGARSAGSGAAIILADAPPEAIWKCLVDSDHLPEFMPRLVDTELYEQREDGIGLQYELKVAWKKVRYHLREIHDAGNWHLTFELDPRKENDLKATKGGWLLVPHGEDQTIVVYAVEADTGMPVPAFIENWLMNRDLPGVVEAVKYRAESGGTYQK